VVKKQNNLATKIPEYFVKTPEQRLELNISGENSDIKQII